MKRQWEETLVTIACVGIVVGLTWILAGFRSDDRWRDFSVDRGHAEYYLDARHNRQWRWKTNVAWVHVEQATNGNFVVTFPQPSTNVVLIPRP